MSGEQIAILQEIANEFGILDNIISCNASPDVGLRLNQVRNKIELLLRDAKQQ